MFALYLVKTKVSICAGSTAKPRDWSWPFANAASLQHFHFRRSTGQRRAKQSCTSHLPHADGQSFNGQFNFESGKIRKSYCSFFFPTRILPMMWFSWVNPDFASAIHCRMPAFNSIHCKRLIHCHVAASRNDSGGDDLHCQQAIVHKTRCRQPLGSAWLCGQVNGSDM